MAWQTQVLAPWQNHDQMTRLFAVGALFSGVIWAAFSIGYVDEANGRYKTSKMAQKWLIEDEQFDAEALFCFWNAASRDLSPHTAEVIRSGERPFARWVAVLRRVAVAGGCGI